MFDSNYILLTVFKCQTVTLFLISFRAKCVIQLRMFHAFDCVKNVRIQSYSGPHFPAFGLNTER